MNFLADENIDKQIVERLRQAGYQVWYVTEIFPSISDDIVLQLANKEQALLLTADKDFGELVFRQRLKHLGVILIRLAGLSSNVKAETVLSAISKHISDLPDTFTVITPGQIRFTKLS